MDSQAVAVGVKALSTIGGWGSYAVGGMYNFIVNVPYESGKFVVKGTYFVATTVGFNITSDGAKTTVEGTERLFITATLVVVATIGILTTVGFLLKRKMDYFDAEAQGHFDEKENLKDQVARLTTNYITETKRLGDLLNETKRELKEVKAERKESSAFTQIGVLIADLIKGDKTLKDYILENASLNFLRDLGTQRQMSGVKLNVSNEVMEKKKQKAKEKAEAEEFIVVGKSGAIAPPAPSADGLKNRVPYNERKKDEKFEDASSTLPSSSTSSSTSTTAPKKAAATTASAPQPAIDLNAILKQKEAMSQKKGLKESGSSTTVTPKDDANSTAMPPAEVEDDSEEGSGTMNIKSDSDVAQALKEKPDSNAGIEQAAGSLEAEVAQEGGRTRGVKNRPGIFGSWFKRDESPTAEATT